MPCRLPSSVRTSSASSLKMRGLDWIIENQPWNFRGSLILLNQILGDEYPTELALHTVSFWVQIHGLQLRAMNKAVGEDVGALIGEVFKISCDDEGTSIGQCLRVKAQIDILKPLLQWTNVCIGGSICKVLFRYEKLADYCYVCGSLTHLEKHCPIAYPDGLRFYGPWLRDNGQNPINLYEVSCELNSLNAKKSSPSLNSVSPRTPTSKDLFTSTPNIPLNTISNNPKYDTTHIPINGLLQHSTTPITKGSSKNHSTSPLPGFHKPN